MALARVPAVEPFVHVTPGHERGGTRRPVRRALRRARRGTRSRPRLDELSLLRCAEDAECGEHAGAGRHHHGSMPSSSATAQACSGPAPPNASSATARGSTPYSTVTTRTARAIAASTTATTPSAVTPARSSAARAAATSSRPRPGSSARRRDAAQHQVGVGDGRRRAAEPVAARVPVRRPHSRVRLRAHRPDPAAPPSRHRPRWCGSPATAAARGGRRRALVVVGAGTPSCTRHTSVLVPPMSNATASAKPHAPAIAAAARDATGRARQQQPRRVGGGFGRAATNPPAEVITSTSSATGPRLPRYGAHTDAERRVGDRGDEPLVLAELGRHLVRAHDLVTAAAEHAGHRAFVRWGRGRRAAGTPPPRRPRRRRGPRRRTARARRPWASSRPPTSNRNARGHERRRPVDVGVVERRPGLPRDLDHVGEATRGHQRDASEPAFEQRVGRHGGAVREHRHRRPATRHVARVDAPRATDQPASTAACGPRPAR